MAESGRYDEFEADPDARKTRFSLFGFNLTQARAADDELWCVSGARNQRAEAPRDGGCSGAPSSRCHRCWHDDKVSDRLTARYFHLRLVCEQAPNIFSRAAAAPSRAQVPAFVGLAQMPF